MPGRSPGLAVAPSHRQTSGFEPQLALESGHLEGAGVEIVSPPGGLRQTTVRCSGMAALNGRQGNRLVEGDEATEVGVAPPGAVVVTHQDGRGSLLGPLHAPP